MNVGNINNIHQCTSCQLCGAVCPKEAISILLDKEGFYRPVINENKCIDCGQCVKICYKYDDNIQMTSDADLMNRPLFSAWAVDKDVLKSTTSGGIGDILAHQLLKEGYKVVGVIYNEQKIRAEHYIAQTDEELLLFRGSKYIQSYTFDALKEIIQNIQTEKYAFFGTPCQIYALHQLVNKKQKHDNFLFVDLYCHGCPSLHIWTKYQAKIKNKLNLSHFKRVEFRSKIKGWGTYVVVVGDNGKPLFVSTPAEDGFYELFFSNSVLNDSCITCLLRSSLEYTDIRIGDFWGKKYLDNHKGVSAISIVTDRGMKLFNKIQPYIVSSQCDYQEFLPYQSWNLSYKIDVDERSNLLRVLENPNSTIDDALRIIRNNQTIKERFRRYIKNILYYLPLGFTTTIKKML